MKRYEKYKPSGVEWIGEIPEHWDLATVGRVSNIGRGRVISNVEIGENAGEYPVYSSQTENNGVMGYLNTFDFDGEYVTWTTDGANAGTVFHREGKFNCTNVCGTIQPKNWKQIDLRFLPYFLNLGTRFSVRLDINPKLMNNMMAKIPFVIPPKIEQATIANFLDEKTAQIDTLIKKKQKLIELLKEERTAIINHAVTKGINPKAKLKPSGIEWLGDIPEHWEVKRLKYLINEGRSSIKTGPFGSQLKNSDLVVEGPFKVYNQRNVLDNDFDAGEDFIEENKFEDLKGFEIFERDVLFTTRGTIGKCAIFPAGKQRGVLHPCLIRVQFDDLKVNKEWIRLFVNQSSLFLENVMLLSNSTTIEVIYSYNLKEVYIPLPETIKEQKDIVDHVEIEIQRVDATISKIEKEIGLLQEYRTALISEAVTGKIKVI